jgi:hypothetical protein
MLFKKKIITFGKLLKNNSIKYNICQQHLRVLKLNKKAWKTVRKKYLKASKNGSVKKINSWINP